MSTDIRVGDLVKVTSKQDPEYIRQSRVASVRDGFVSLKSGAGFWLLSNDVEVLDRPRAPIDKELLRGASRVYTAGMGYVHLLDTDSFDAGLVPVINFIREYDNNKESK